MRYRIELSNRAAKDLDRLGRDVRERIMKRLDDLAQDPYDARLSGPLTNQGNLRKSRVGGWRIIFAADDEPRILPAVRSNAGAKCISGSETSDTRWANEGRMTSQQYPLSGPNLGYAYDTMGRLNTMTDLGRSSSIIRGTGTEKLLTNMSVRAGRDTGQVAEGQRSGEP